MKTVSALTLLLCTATIYVNAQSVSKAPPTTNPPKSSQSAVQKPAATDNPAIHQEGVQKNLANTSASSHGIQASGTAGKEDGGKINPPLPDKGPSGPKHKVMSAGTQQQMSR